MESSQSHHLMKRVIDSKTPQECITTLSSPKPNQVSTVLLYGIPIVSLYIESQERLCLAQISNTLLKQFSYNEIHNRRVALGITCVQCTPVQLEILRRAGAMPVSSRRCGMITRREAERLCKSFLGDNAPPRLPEDFAFSVHHECAWGCRGSFLPARYNSSRAKCIKCAYCGLFFSPNKFIFHSHRIGPGDKYVQPDAANFNSWRRHMKLSGNAPEEIVHAWEDVKAMFNGGTRKRLLTSSSSSSSPPNGCNNGHSSRNSHVNSPKRAKDMSAAAAAANHLSPPLMHAAAAAVVSAAATATAAAVANQFPIRPVQLHPSATQTPTTPGGNSAAPAASPNSANPTISRLSSELTLPFSRSFMMDYMWHAQSKASTFQFPNYALPWIKRPGALIFNQQQQQQSQQQSPQQQSASAASSSIGTALGIIEEVYVTDASSFYNNSAFKPVINSNHQGRTSSIGVILPVSLDDDQHTSSSRNSRDEGASGSTIKESMSSDDEMVDIETTEDEDRHSRDQHHHHGLHYRHLDEFMAVKLPPQPSPPIVEIETSNEMGWEAASYLKKEPIARVLSNLRTTPPPTSPIPSHQSSPTSTSSYGGGGGGGRSSGGVCINEQHSIVGLSTTTASSSSNQPTLGDSPTVHEQHHHHQQIDQLTASKAAAASITPTMKIRDIPSPATSPSYQCHQQQQQQQQQLQQNHHQRSININSLTSNHNLSSNNNNNNNNCSNSSNSNSSNFHSSSSSSLNHCNSSSSDQLWSFARLSFDRPEYRLPFYRHDITKHFQAFRHHGEQTTQTNGIG